MCKKRLGLAGLLKEYLEVAIFVIKLCRLQRAVGLHGRKLGVDTVYLRIYRAFDRIDRPCVRVDIDVHFFVEVGAERLHRVEYLRGISGQGGSEGI